MKPYVKTNIFVIMISVLSALIIAVGVFSIITSLENNALKNRVVEVSANADSKEEYYNQIKADNEAILKEIEDIKWKNSELQKEIENQKKLLNAVNQKKLIEVEKVLATQNSPQPTAAPNSKVCYLTFDDGPSDRTLEILNILDKYDAKATFFVLGNGKLEYLPKIVEKGHKIGLHSNTHKYNEIYKSTDAYFNDLQAVSDKVYNACGIRTKIMRFPGGSSNLISKKACKGIMTRLTSQVKIKGYAYFDWNIDSGDAASKDITAATITANVLNSAAKKTSICVLMHDISSKTATVEALPEILDGLKAMGYRFEVLNENSFGYQHNVQN